MKLVYCAIAMAVASAFAAPVVADDYDLDAMRTATEKYKNVEVALSEGFIPDPTGHCVDAAAEEVTDASRDIRDFIRHTLDGLDEL